LYDATLFNEQLNMIPRWDGWLVLPRI